MAPRLIRPVEIGGDENPRQAFENHFFDGVAIMRERASNAGAQRALVVGQAAQDFHKFCADHLLPLLCVGEGADSRHGLLAAVEVLLRDAVQPLEQWVGFGFLGRAGDDKKKSYRTQ
jgi:hypothetical protein